MQERPLPTRRRFLSTAAASVAASPLLASAQDASAQDASAQEPADERPALRRPALRKSLKQGMIRTATSIAEKFEQAKEAGFDGIEFDGPVPEGNLPQIREAAAATELVVPGLVAGAAGRMMSLDRESERREGVERFARALRDAKELGGNTVLLYPGLVNESFSYEVVHDRLRVAIAELIPVSEETGVKIALENVWNNIFLSPLEARDFVDSFDSPQVGWYFDVGNVVRFGWPEQWIRILGKRILKLDIKEYSRKLQNDEGLWKGFSAKLGEGSVDWAAVMKALTEIGYDGGWGSAEVAGGDLERLRDVSRRMDRVFSL